MQTLISSQAFWVTVAGLLREIMEGAAHLSVPLTVEVGHGPNRDTAH